MQAYHRRTRPAVSSSAAHGTEPLYAHTMTVHLSDSEDTTYVWGYGLLLMTWLMFFMTMYSLVGCYWVTSDNKLLTLIRNDNYYCFVFPITAIAFVYFVIWNWMGMKFFRHN
ncbi:hypothetical protein BDF14DRAFT_1859346 [Spinellus fusiger]|nr:hypothetical protein BDF14DRAFT_1859346 [Spinellus fusiger]